MLYKMSLSVSEIPPLFVQLDRLETKENNEYTFWKEKARYVLNYVYLDQLIV